MAHSTFLGLTHRPGVELAERLIRIAPRGLKRVFYSDSGSEAMEIALKIAFQYWQQEGSRRREFITLAQAYHGDTVGSVSLGGIDLFHKIYRPLLFRTTRVPTTYAYRWKGRPTLRQCGKEVLGRIESVLRKRARKVAAVVIEPMMQGAAGMIHQPPGFIRRLRALTRRYGVLMIADEVATGFGRTGRMFAVDHERVSPDIMALAKGLTAGYLPLAVTMTTEKIYRAFRGSLDRTFFHGHTYTANPLACAAALANLDLFRKRRIIGRLGPRIRALSDGLGSLADSPWVGEVRQVGLMAGVELVEDRDRRRSFPGERRVGRQVCLKARRYGVILRPLGDVVVFMPPLAMTERQILQVVGAARSAIRDVLG
jgi:adenosylmethionine-8-amino-7-oxononanoate transaminase